MNSKQLAWLIRRDGVEMTHVSGGSHIASILSVADIVAVLYNDVANVAPDRLDDPDRDRIVLSKGHAGAAIYSALANKGYFDRSELMTHYANGSRLSGHVSHKGVPGVEVSTGSLGHGICMASGMALASKMDHKRYQTFAIVGDGECDEGSVWETALFANHFGLSGLTVIVDYNKMQSLDYCEKTLQLNSFADKWRAFGWNVTEVDGHDHDQLRRVLKKTKTQWDKPNVIIAHTVKGKGVSFMERDILWHYRFPHDGGEYETAVAELNAAIPDGMTDPYLKGEQK